MANKTGFISVLPIDGVNNAVSATDVRSSPNRTAALFGNTTIPETNNLLPTDATFGATILSVDP